MHYIIIGFIALLFIFIISIDNRFKRIKVRINQSISGIDTCLTRRFDTLTKLVEITKDFMAHEENLLTSIVEKRQGLSKMSVKEKETFDAEINQVTQGLRVQMEAYPELKSSNNVRDLQKAIMDTENELMAARRLYNSNVAIYNEMILVFPSSVIAGMRHYQAEDFFQAEEKKRQDVDVSLR